MSTNTALPDSVSASSASMNSQPDQHRRRALVRMRAIATGLLILATLVYLLTARHSDAGWLGYVNAAAEAAMVGAIADWFAVTAIFRHPLGIPIPHTALIRRRKNDLGKSLQTFVADNFLTPDVIAGKVLDTHVAERLGDWLSDRSHRELVLAKATRGLRAALARLDDADVTGLLTETIIPRLQGEQWSPAAGALLERVIADNGHLPVVDMISRELSEWLAAHPDLVKRTLRERIPGWVPGFIDQRLADYFYQQALDWALAVHAHPGHPARIMLDGFLRKLAEDLQHDDVTMRRAEDFKARLLDNSGTFDAIQALWRSLHGSLDQAIENSDSPLLKWADSKLEHLGFQLTTDAELSAIWDVRIADGVRLLSQTYGREVASVVSSTVERWDPDDTSERIELFVGKDLQYIRINGTVVGALVGLVIHAMTQLVGMI